MKDHKDCVNWHLGGGGSCTLTHKSAFTGDVVTFAGFLVFGHRLVILHRLLLQGLVSFNFL